LALRAAWVAKLEDAVNALQDLVEDLDDVAAPSDAEHDGDGEDETQEEDPLAVALGVVEERYEEEDRELEGRLIAWLSEDPEHWSIFRLVVLDPWQERPGVWRAGAPGWVRALATDAALAHFQHDPLGRQQVLDLDR
jgi:hypothetical protein